MPGYKTAVKMRLENPPEATAKEFKEIVRASGDRTAGDWHEKYMPRRFAPHVHRRYRMERRSIGHRKRKEREAARGQIPKRAVNANVLYTGDTENAATRFFSAKSSGTKTTVTMPVPFYVRNRPRAGQPNMAAELAWIPSDEERFISTRIESYGVIFITRKKATKEVTL